MIERNAIICSAYFETERGLSAWLVLDFGGGQKQGFGGYSLYPPQNKGNYAGHFIWRVFQIAEVNDWCALVGKPARVRIGDLHIVSIGHIIKDDWFDPAKEFEEIRLNSKIQN